MRKQIIITYKMRTHTQLYTLLPQLVSHTFHNNERFVRAGKANVNGKRPLKRRACTIEIIDIYYFYGMHASNNKWIDAIGLIKKNMKT